MPQGSAKLLGWNRRLGKYERSHVTHCSGNPALPAGYEMEEKKGKNGERRRYTSWTHSVRNAPGGAIVASSESFMSFAPIGGSFLFAWNALHFYDRSKVTCRVLYRDLWGLHACYEKLNANILRVNILGWYIRWTHSENEVWNFMKWNKLYGISYL